MNARVINFMRVMTVRRCPWCDERLEATDDTDTIRHFDRRHQRCRDAVRFVERSETGESRDSERARSGVARSVGGVRR